MQRGLEPCDDVGYTPCFTVQFQCIICILLALGLAACGPTYRAVEVKPDSSNSSPSSGSAGAPVEEAAAPRAVPLDGFKSVQWKTLRGLELKSGKTTPELASLVGANIRINGFMVPFDDEDEQVSEFLLVPQAGMCIHTPPPPANQIILVEVSTGGANRVEWDKEVSVYGQFQIVDGNSPYGKTGFKISAIRARPD